MVWVTNGIIRALRNYLGLRKLRPRRVRDFVVILDRVRFKPRFFNSQCHVLSSSLCFFLSVINNAALKTLNHMYLPTGQLLRISCIIYKFGVIIGLLNK